MSAGVLFLLVFLVLTCQRCSTKKTTIKRPESSEKSRAEKNVCRRRREVVGNLKIAGAQFNVTSVC